MFNEGSERGRPPNDDEDDYSYRKEGDMGLNPRVQRHLVRVYGHLSITSLFALLAAFLALSEYLPQPNLLYGLLLSLGLLMLAQTSSFNLGIRTASLYGFGFLQGWNALSPVLRIVAPETAISALLGALLLFVSFSGTAIYAPRRALLFLIGPLSFVLALLFISSLVGLFVPRLLPSLFSFELYAGLFLLTGYVLFDTQLMIERARSGRDTDAITPAATLFSDLLGIAIRLLVIQSRSTDRDKRRNRRQR